MEQDIVLPGKYTEMTDDEMEYDGQMSWQKWVALGVVAVTASLFASAIIFQSGACFAGGVFGLMGSAYAVSTAFNIHTGPTAPIDEPR